MEVSTVNDFFNITIGRVLECYVYGLGIGMAVKLFVYGMKR